MSFLIKTEWEVGGILAHKRKDFLKELAVTPISLPMATACSRMTSDLRAHVQGVLHKWKRTNHLFALRSGLALWQHPSDRQE